MAERVFIEAASGYAAREGVLLACCQRIAAGAPEGWRFVCPTCGAGWQHVTAAELAEQLNFAQADISMREAASAGA